MKFRLMNGLPSCVGEFTFVENLTPLAIRGGAFDNIRDTSSPFHAKPGGGAGGGGGANEANEWIIAR